MLVDTTRGVRLRDGFLYGEKATSALESQRKDVPEPALCAVRQLRPGDRINALGNLEVMLQNSEALIQNLRNRGFNVVLIPEIRRFGELNWLRIEAPNRYYRQIAAADIDEAELAARLAKLQAPSHRGDTTKSNPHQENPGCLTHYDIDPGPMALTPRRGNPTFEVTRVELERNQFLREGAWVPVLYFYDLLQKYDCPYLRDLRSAAIQGRPLLSLDLRALPVVAAENTPQLYQARDGDRLRIRVLVAEQDVRQRDRALELLNEQRLPDVPEYRYTTHLTLADDIEFLVAEYGLRLQIVPAVTYGSEAGDLQADAFNPVKTAPAITSVFYLRYHGRRVWLTRVQWLPGAFASLLGLDGEDTRFTAGLAWSPPSLRRWINLVYGWHDLKTPVLGLAISPNVDFQAMLTRDKPGQ